MKLVAQRWQNREVPLADGVVFADGSVALARSFTLASGGVVRSGVGFIADSTLESVLSYDADPWFSVEVQSECERPEDSLRCVAGGGAMGNQGFVALTDLAGAPIWIASFVSSNPFEAVRFETGPDGLLVVATSTYEQEWRFPVRRPTAVRIDPPAVECQE